MEIATTRHLNTFPKHVNVVKVRFVEIVFLATERAVCITVAQRDARPSSAVISVLGQIVRMRSAEMMLTGTAKSVAQTTFERLPNDC